MRTTLTNFNQKILIELLLDLEADCFLVSSGKKREQRSERSHSIKNCVNQIL